MTENIIIAIVAAIGGSGSLYLIQSFFPTAADKAAAEKQEIENEILGVGFLVAQLKELSTGFAEREREYLEAIAELRAETDSLRNEIAELRTALSESQRTIGALQASLELERQSTIEIENLKLITTLFDMSNKLGYDEISAEIKRVAQQRPALGRRIAEN